jgi:hypothetical protein
LGRQPQGQGFFWRGQAGEYSKLSLVVRAAKQILSGH